MLYNVDTRLLPNLVYLAGYFPMFKILIGTKNVRELFQYCLGSGVESNGSRRPLSFPLALEIVRMKTV